jgi:translation initiation factor IF-3
MFRGREQSRPELGYRLLRKLEEEVAELGFVEAAPKQDGRNMIMVIAPRPATKAAALRAGTATATRLHPDAATEDAEQPAPPGAEPAAGDQ